MVASYAKIKYVDIEDQLIVLDPLADLDCVVVIPSYAETELSTTLRSLDDSMSKWCTLSSDHKSRVEVIALINQSEDVDASYDAINHQCYAAAINVSLAQLKVHLVFITEIPAKKAGVGLARRLAMDEAALRLAAVGNNSQGLIVNLDADCTVSSNYLESIRTFMNARPKIDLANIHFEHDLSTALHAKGKAAIIDYELHLRYFIGMQRWLGLPYAYQTIGSAFVVRSDVYVSMGRMNLRKAGEDFYYIHKFTKKGTVADLNSAAVYPSSRSSFRVPFGTGKAVADLLSSDEDYTTYHPQSFIDLRILIDNVDLLFEKDDVDMAIYPAPLSAYLGTQNYKTVLSKLKGNARSLTTFRKAFFQWFDAFRLMKYLHTTRDNYYPNVTILEALRMSTTYLEVEYQEDKLQLLKEMRARQNGVG